jgi:RNA polymerase sigma-70 factor (ECF subfamily)
MPTASPTLGALTPPTDDELVVRIRAGDPRGFELLMRRHNQRLFRLARGIVRNEAEAEEIVQESYVRAFTHLRGFEGRSSVATWLSRITLHEALRSRRRYRRDHAGGTVDMERQKVGAEDQEPSVQSDRAELRSMLIAALDSLPTRHRAVVMLRLVEGLDTRETAECLRMSEASVKVSLHRARALLSEFIQRRTIVELREHFSFASERCDRIVAGVFTRLDLPAPPP